MKAIETSYKGYRFRSRLEARWAVFFDAAGIDYHYELQGFNLGDAGPYLPDFYLSTFDMWAEVKPMAFDDQSMAKAIALVWQSRKPLVMLDGVPEDRPFGILLIALEGGVWGVVKRDFILVDGSGGDSYWFTHVSADPLNEHGYKRYCSAIQAARSARFEHGEVGR